MVISPADAAILTPQQDSVLKDLESKVSAGIVRNYDPEKQETYAVFVTSDPLEPKVEQQLKLQIEKDWNIMEWNHQGRKGTITLKWFEVYGMDNYWKHNYHVRLKKK
ncbi:MAG: hypothetical protein ABIF10_03875 [Candidatus Woesearchaeota archaeon]